MLKPAVNESTVTRRLGVTFLDLDEVQHPTRITPDPRAGRPSVANRAYHVTRQLGPVAIHAVFENAVLVEPTKGKPALIPYTGSGQALRTYPDHAVKLSETDANDMILEVAAREHRRHSVVLNEAGRRNSSADEKRLSNIVALGLDLLGDNAAQAVISARAASLNTAALRAQANAAPRPVAPPTADALEATPVPAKDLAAPKLTVRSATAQFIRAIVGSDKSAIVAIKEDRQAVITDALYALAGALDRMGTTRLVFDKVETIGMLRRAVAAVGEMKFLKPIAGYGPGDEVQLQPTTPEGVLAYPFRDLADRLERTTTDWVMFSEKDAREMCDLADRLREWLRYQKGAVVAEDADSVDAEPLFAALDEACACAGSGGSACDGMCSPEAIADVKKKARARMKQKMAAQSAES